MDIPKVPSFIPEKPEHEFKVSTYTVKEPPENGEQYDFAAARPQTKTICVSESLGHLLKICLGSGVVTIHEAYKMCGVWTALGLNIVLALAVSYSMYILVQSAQKMYCMIQVPSLTYPDLAEASVEVGPSEWLKKFSKCFRYLVDSTISLALFSTCCVYQVIIARSLKQLVEGADVLVAEGHPPLTTYILALLCPLLLLCMITTMKYLAPFTVVANSFIVCVTVSTVYYGTMWSTKSLDNLPAFQSVFGVFEFIGICIFTISGIGATLPIENLMAEPKKFPMVIVGGMSVVSIVVIFNGFFGYWYFGDRVQSPITLNYPWKAFPVMLKVFLTLMLYITYALNFWIAFEIVWYYVKLKHAPAHYWFWERVYRGLFVTLITLVACLLPSVTHLSGLIGSLCLANIGFTYPAIIELLVNWKDPGLGFLKWRFLKFACFFLFGLVVSGSGTYVNGKAMITEIYYRHKNDKN